MINKFTKAQNAKSPYTMFVLSGCSQFSNDMARNRNMGVSLQVINKLTSLIEEREVKSKTKILVQDDFMVVNQNVAKLHPEDINHYRYNPFCIQNGTFFFYCYNNSLNEKEFLNLFEVACKAYNHESKYLFAKGNFEATQKNNEDKLTLLECAKELVENPLRKAAILFEKATEENREEDSK